MGGKRVGSGTGTGIGTGAGAGGRSVAAEMEE